MEISADYKGTREYHDKDNFRVQRKKSISMIKESVPFLVMRHPEMEADDVIADLTIRLLPHDHEKVVVSSDTDFIQLCQDPNNNVKLYNPIKKDFRDIPEYPYAEWKALRGDSADNIPGIRGIGNKRATALVTDRILLEQFLDKKDDHRRTFRKNIDMIELRSMSCEEYSEMQIWFANEPLELLKETFTQMKLKSMITDKAWNNYARPFGGLEDGRKYFVE